MSLTLAVVGQLLLQPSVQLTIMCMLAFTAGFSSLNTPCGWNALLAVTRPSSGLHGVRSAASRQGITSFVIGTLVGAAILGVSLGWLGSRLHSTAPILVQGLGVLGGMAGLLYILSALARRKLPVPTSRWRVPMSWARFGPSGFPFLFGVVLGSGFITIVNFIGYYLLLVMCVTAGFPASVFAMLVFGAARSLPAVLTGTLLTVAGDAAYSVTDNRLQTGLALHDRHLASARAITLGLSSALLIAVALS